MKILIIMDGFFPGRKYGGPPVSVDNFCSLMKGIADCYIVTHNHDMGETTPYKGINDGWVDRGNAMVMYLCDKKYNYATFKKVVGELKPDFLYLQGLFQYCVLPCLRLARITNLKVVLAPRGELLCMGGFKKKSKKIIYIKCLRILGLIKKVVFQSTSEEESNAISYYLGAPFRRIHLIPNIPSLPSSLQQPRSPKNSGVGRFVFLSRIVEKKNLLNAISLFKDVIGKAAFDIYGPKEDLAYWAECEKAIKRLNDNILVSYKGVLNHDEVHSTLCKYDAFLFPTYSENYGHVIAEAMLSGCIPIISDQTPWNDINEVKAGWAIPLNKPTAFTQAIQSIIDMKEEDICRIQNNIQSYLNGTLRLDEAKNKYNDVFNNC